MPRIAYLDKNIRADRMQLITWAGRVAADYAARGFSLTLRQLYYQGVAANVFANADSSYKKLGEAVSDGRLIGAIDWNHLTDRHRETQNTAWAGAGLPALDDLIRNLENDVSHDLWRGQPYRPEIWVEKDALAEVAQHGARGFRVPFMSCKGYMSQSQMWEAGHRRMRYYLSLGQRPVIIHLGDHDPSGIDMTRDIEERLSMFAESPVEVRRIALNYDQIQEYDPPPNPAKMTDSRFNDYARLYGDESWELDSLRPEILIDLIRNEIQSLIEPDAWRECEEEEETATEEVRNVADRWDDIQAWLRDNED